MKLKLLYFLLSVEKSEMKDLDLSFTSLKMRVHSPITSTHAPIPPFTSIKHLSTCLVNLSVGRLNMFNLECKVELSWFLHNVMTFNIGYHSCLNSCTSWSLPNLILLKPSDDVLLFLYHLLESNYSWSFYIGNSAILLEVILVEVVG